MALTGLGNALREAARFDQAITAHHDAIVIQREAGDRHDEAVALNNLGVALREAHRFDKAITVCRNAAAIFHETGDPRSESMALRNLEAATTAGKARRQALRLWSRWTCNRAGRQQKDI